MGCAVRATDLLGAHEGYHIAAVITVSGEISSGVSARVMRSTNKPRAPFSRGERAEPATIDLLRGDYHIQGFCLNIRQLAVVGLADARIRSFRYARPQHAPASHPDRIPAHHAVSGVAVTTVPSRRMRSKKRRREPEASTFPAIAHYGGGASRMCWLSCAAPRLPSPQTLPTMCKEDTIRGNHIVASLPCGRHLAFVGLNVTCFRPFASPPAIVCGVNPRRS